MRGEGGNRRRRHDFVVRQAGLRPSWTRAAATGRGGTGRAPAGGWADARPKAGRPGGSTQHRSPVAARAPAKAKWSLPQRPTAKSRPSTSVTTNQPRRAGEGREGGGRRLRHGQQPAVPGLRTQRQARRVSVPVQRFPAQADRNRMITICNLSLAFGDRRRTSEAGRRGASCRLPVGWTES